MDNQSKAPPSFFRIWLCGAFRVERRVGDRYEAIQTVEWGGSAYPRQLLKALLCCPGRQGRREALIELLWPDGDFEQAVRNFNTATTKLRAVLRPARDQESLLVTEDDAGVYRLADQQRLWVDADAGMALLKEAEQRGRTSPDALALLEEAADVFNKGMLLQDEEGLWAASKRATMEQIRYRCRIWLAEAYEHQGRPGQAEMILSLLLEEDFTDEDVLCRLLELLHQQGMTHQALRFYERWHETLSQEGIAPTEAVQQVVARISEERCERGVTRETWRLLLPNFSQAVGQGILSVAVEEGSNATNHLRRQILQQALRGAGFAVLTPRHVGHDSEVFDRLAQALTKPASIDKKTLLYLERRIEGYWQDRNAVVLPAWNLLSYVTEDLQRITALLEGSLPPTLRMRLCSIVGNAAMLVGELHYDMGNQAQARLSQELAITAAREANNRALEAVAWARHSFAWTYDGNAFEAYNSIRQARHLAGSVNSMIRPWLAAVEAEIQAHLGNREACLAALNEAAQVEDQEDCQAECYWTHFDRSLYAGYQGVSFLRLSSFGHEDLIQNAQIVLLDALKMLDSSMKRRQPTLLVDLAGTYVQQHNIEQACDCALKAMQIATQINSNISLQRLLTLRSSLEPWKETGYVQKFDKAISLRLTVGRQ